MFSYRFALAVLLGLILAAMPWAAVGLTSQLGRARKEDLTLARIFKQKYNINVLSVSRWGCRGLLLLVLLLLLLPRVCVPCWPRAAVVAHLTGWRCQPTSPCTCCAWQHAGSGTCLGRHMHKQALATTHHSCIYPSAAPSTHYIACSRRTCCCRFFLFGSRDMWFEVPLPFFLRDAAEGLGWDRAYTGLFLALFIIVYGQVGGMALVQQLGQRL
jgi:hypothetical protein